LISTVGAGLAGAAKKIFQVDTDVIWELAAILSVILAVIALWRRAPEIKFGVFESIVVFDRLATQVRQKTNTLRIQGTEDDITRSYSEIYNTLSDELRKLGPDHTGYADRYGRGLRRKLNRVLRDDGAISP
jgi:hypothetical protein